MRVGTGVIFQNPGKGESDADIYKRELRLADLIEPLGFDSFWGVEHHYTDYTMCPNVLQLLSYMAGRTMHIQLGSMVIVLPWHNPMRAVEEISMMDHLCGGRFILGIGRGLGRIEFEGLGIPMGESRGRFIESAGMILKGLENGYIESDGPHYKSPRRDVRPAPLRTFRGRAYAAAVSPESQKIMAELGVGVLIIPQKPWSEMAHELKTYRDTFQAVNNRPAPATVCAGWTFVDEDAGRAEEMARKYIGGYLDSVLLHYELLGGHMENTNGYEYYAKNARMAAMAGELGEKMFREMFISLQFWGTPERVYNRIMETRALIGCDTYTGVFSYAGMPEAEAERNMRLFAREVMPELKKVPDTQIEHETEEAIKHLRV